MLVDGAVYVAQRAHVVRATRLQLVVSLVSQQGSDRGGDRSAFSRDRARPLAHTVADEFFRLVVAAARARQLLSHEHFTGGGTLIEACAPLKSFKHKDAGAHEPPDDPGNPAVNFRGERRASAAHQSATG